MRYAFLLLLLAGCAPKPVLYRDAGYDDRGGKEAAAAAVKECRAIAKAEVGKLNLTPVASRSAWGAATGAAMGAVTGLITGDLATAPSPARPSAPSPAGGKAPTRRRAPTRWSAPTPTAASTSAAGPSSAGVRPISPAFLPVRP